jgi:hypothetical protein
LEPTEIFIQGSEFGILPERIDELIEIYRIEFRKEPAHFSDLLEVLE